jgi:hypothetical protein
MASAMVTIQPLTEWLFTHSDHFFYHFKLDDVKDFIERPRQYVGPIALDNCFKRVSLVVFEIHG